MMLTFRNSRHFDTRYLVEEVGPINRVSCWLIDLTERLIYVDEQHRGRGLGRRLLATA
ncbi:MAG: hypothetical protein JWN03_1886 [Nocardia sp.]|nr:hypothetical protein [Nocardia sp.]